MACIRQSGLVGLIVLLVPGFIKSDHHHVQKYELKSTQKKTDITTENSLYKTETEEDEPVTNHSLEFFTGAAHVLDLWSKIRNMYSEKEQPKAFPQNLNYLTRSDQKKYLLKEQIYPKKVEIEEMYTPNTFFKKLKSQSPNGVPQTVQESFISQTDPFPDISDSQNESLRPVYTENLNNKLPKPVPIPSPPQTWMEEDITINTNEVNPYQNEIIDEQQKTVVYPQGYQPSNSLSMEQNSQQEEKPLANFHGYQPLISGSSFNDYDYHANHSQKDDIVETLSKYYYIRLKLWLIPLFASVVFLLMNAMFILKAVEKRKKTKLKFWDGPHDWVEGKATINHIELINEISNNITKAEEKYNDL